MKLILIYFIKFTIAVKFYNDLSLSKIKENIFSEEVENVPITFTPFVASNKLIKNSEKSKIPIRRKLKTKDNDDVSFNNFQSKIPVKCKKNKELKKTNEDSTYEFTKLNFVKNIELEEKIPEISDETDLIFLNLENLPCGDQIYMNQLFELQDSYKKLIKKVINNFKIVYCKYKLSSDYNTKNLSVNISLIEAMTSQLIHFSKECISLYKNLQWDMKTFCDFDMLDELEFEFSEFLAEKNIYETLLTSSLVFLDDLNKFETYLKFFYEKTENFLDNLEKKFDSLNVILKKFEQNMFDMFLKYEHVVPIVRIFEYINALYIIDKNSNLKDFAKIKNSDDFFNLPYTEKIFKYNLNDFISQNKECIEYWDNLREIIITTKNNMDFSMLIDSDSIDELFEKIIGTLKDEKNGFLSNVCQKVDVSSFSQKLQELSENSFGNIENILVEMIVEYFAQYFNH